MTRRFQYMIVCMSILGLGGFSILMYGVDILPQKLSSDQIINPETGSVYSLNEQRIVFNRIVIQSKGFLYTISGASALAVSLVAFFFLYLYNKYYKNKPRIINIPIEQPAVLESQQPTIDIVVVSEPTDPLPMHLPSTIDVRPTTVVSKSPQTWNELKLKRLQGQTFSI